MTCVAVAAILALLKNRSIEMERAEPDATRDTKGETTQAVG